MPIWELHTISPQGQDFVYCVHKFKKVLLNYTLKQLQDRVNNLIKVQGEDAHCAAWIYTAEDCYLEGDDDAVEQTYPCDNNPELAERIFNDIGNNDYIYQIIQESVDEATEEHFMLIQQELV